MCPLSGNCLQSSVIYKATVKSHNTNTSETYISLTENDFKTRYGNHVASFCHADMEDFDSALEKALQC